MLVEQVKSSISSELSQVCCVQVNSSLSIEPVKSSRVCQTSTSRGPILVLLNLSNEQVKSNLLNERVHSGLLSECV